MVDPAPASRRVDGSMSLLVDMSDAALDPAYAEVAARKAVRSPSAGEDAPAGRRVRVVRAIVLLLLLGLVTGVGTAQVRRSADAGGAVRRSLMADIRSQTKDTDQLSAQVDALRAQVAQARDTGLGDDASGRELAARVAALELATGQTKVTGPGVVVTLDDAPDADSSADARGGQLGDGRIYDRDLQDVANALWAAGAEAISVNGQRLTALTAIRSAGEAVLVDFRPLSPPYRLSAVGDVDVMEPAFVDSPTARRFTSYTSLYGLGFEVHRAAKLSLPAAPPPELHVARSATVPTAAPTTTASPTGGNP
jgi:uncharacterized protein YlxW (UPF0749 family)